MDILVSKIISITDNTSNTSNTGNTNDKEQSSAKLINYLDTKSEELELEREVLVNNAVAYLSQQESEYCKKMDDKMLETVTTEAKKEREKERKEIAESISSNFDIFLNEEKVKESYDECIPTISKKINELEKETNVCIKKIQENTYIINSLKQKTIKDSVIEEIGQKLIDKQNGTLVNQFYDKDYQSVIQFLHAQNENYKKQIIKLLEQQIKAMIKIKIKEVVSKYLEGTAKIYIVNNCSEEKSKNACKVVYSETEEEFFNDEIHEIIIQEILIQKGKIDCQNEKEENSISKEKKEEMKDIALKILEQKAECCHMFSENNLLYSGCKIVYLDDNGREEFYSRKERDELYKIEHEIKEERIKEKRIMEKIRTKRITREKAEAEVLEEDEDCMKMYEYLKETFRKSLEKRGLLGRRRNENGVKEQELIEEDEATKELFTVVGNVLMKQHTKKYELTEEDNTIMEKVLKEKFTTKKMHEEECKQKGIVEEVKGITDTKRETKEIEEQNRDLQESSMTLSRVNTEIFGTEQQRGMDGVN